jgi:hypothetical protein
LGSSIERALGGLDSLAGTTVQFARSTEQTFPFVTMFDYGIHASKSMAITQAFGTYMVPVVTFAQRNEWEIYAARYNRNSTSSETNNESSFPSSRLEKLVKETIVLQEGWSRYYGPSQDPKNWRYNDGMFTTMLYNTSITYYVSVVFLHTNIATFLFCS